jgi:hypothetical protein
VADVAKSILPKPEQMTGSDNFETEFMKGVVSGINSLASSLGDALVIEPQGGKVLVVPRTATAAIGKAYFDHERHRLLTKGNDAQWDDLSAQRQRELAEDALELFAALLSPGTVRVARAVGVLEYALRIGDAELEACLMHETGLSGTRLNNGTLIAILEPEPGKEGA